MAQQSVDKIDYIDPCSDHDNIFRQLFGNQVGQQE